MNSLLSACEKPSIDINALISQDNITTRFQSVCSIREKKVKAYEALLRGRPGGKCEYFTPPDLFAAADEQNLAFLLDRKCKAGAIEKFAEFVTDSGDDAPILFLNVYTPLVDRGFFDLAHLRNSVGHAGLSPSKIAIDLVETQAVEASKLREYVDQARALGFLIGLDHFASDGALRLSLVSDLEPDFIKIDHSIVSRVASSPRHRKRFSLIAELARSMGSLVIAEGVESTGDALACLENGATWLQGYLFDGAGSFTPGVPSPPAESDLANVARLYRDYMLKKNITKKTVHITRSRYLSKVIATLAHTHPEDYDDTLAYWVRLARDLECVYILNGSTGTQISSTVFASAFTPGSNTVFRPAEPGTDHSMKEYYFLLHRGMDCYLTEPYVSQATGNRCVTISHSFRQATGGTAVLCADFICDD